MKTIGGFGRIDAGQENSEAAAAETAGEDERAPDIQLKKRLREGPDRGEEVDGILEDDQRTRLGCDNPDRARVLIKIERERRTGKRVARRKIEVYRLDQDRRRERDGRDARGREAGGFKFVIRNVAIPVRWILPDPVDWFLEPIPNRVCRRWRDQRPEQQRKREGTLPRGDCASLARAFSA